MDDEAMKAMARPIVDERTGPNNRGHYLWEPRYAAALAAIIETRDRDAALVEGMIPMPGDPSQLHGTYAQGVFDAATAIRSGQQFRKDV